MQHSEPERHAWERSRCSVRCGIALKPGETMMVAAHEDDLIVARAAGLRTALVRRPLEFGARPGYDLPRERGFDYVADDFVDLARQLGG